MNELKLITLIPADKLIYNSLIQDYHSIDAGIILEQKDIDTANIRLNSMYKHVTTYGANIDWIKMISEFVVIKRCYICGALDYTTILLYIIICKRCFNIICRAVGRETLVHIKNVGKVLEYSKEITFLLDTHHIKTYTVQRIFNNPRHIPLLYNNQFYKTDYLSNYTCYICGDIAPGNKIIYDSKKFLYCHRCTNNIQLFAHSVIYKYLLILELAEIHDITRYIIMKLLI